MAKEKEQTGTLKKYTPNFIEKYFKALSVSKAKKNISEKLVVKKFVKKYMGNN